MDVKRRGFAEHVRVEEALKRYFEKVDVKRLQSEDVLLAEGLGRVLGEDVRAGFDVPHFDRSAVDGYAVRAEDTYGASSTNPMVLDPVGAVEFGKAPDEALGTGQAVRIATGAPLPYGADAVVMLEYAEEVGGNRVEVYRPITPGDNVSLRGEDVKEGELVLRDETILRPQDIGMLAAVGRTRIKVVRRPVVAILSTGNELVEPGTPLELGRTVDTNRYMLAAAVKDAGGKPLDIGIVSDVAGEIEDRVSKGLRLADMVLVSGGTSVGSRDLVPEVVNALGGPGIVVHGIAMRPGRPTALAAVGDRPIALLPGHPVAALIAFDTLVRPVMARMLGAPVGGGRRGVVRARMLRRVPSRIGFRDFVRVVVRRVGDGYAAEPVRVTGAGVISSMVKANGMVVIPEGVEGGEEVEVTLFRPLED
ncbi:MAG: gephyrin-like molybdotransferase Glp [Candidatus Bathyarchaeia archaeon]